MRVEGVRVEKREKRRSASREERVEKECELGCE